MSLSSTVSVRFHVVVLGLSAVGCAVSLAACNGIPGVGCGPAGYGGEQDAASTCGGAYATTPPPGVPANATCSTGAWWQGGNEGTGVMHPGVDCIACHASGEGPRYTVAGTVMGGAKDSDDCEGVSGVVVDITDANGALHSLTTDLAGNFHLEGALATPYTVKLTHNGKTTQMLTPQTAGACLSCHTAGGANGAPGRIVAP